jgi:hypothetical protein
MGLQPHGPGPWALLRVVYSFHLTGAFTCRSTARIDLAEPVSIVLILIGDLATDGGGWLQWVGRCIGGGTPWGGGKLIGAPLQSAPKHDGEGVLA